MKRHQIAALLLSAVLSVSACMPVSSMQVRAAEDISIQEMEQESSSVYLEEDSSGQEEISAEGESSDTDQAGSENTQNNASSAAEEQTSETADEPATRGDSSSGRTVPHKDDSPYEDDSSESGSSKNNTGNKEATLEEPVDDSDETSEEARETASETEETGTKTEKKDQDSSKSKDTGAKTGTGSGDAAEVAENKAETLAQPAKEAEGTSSDTAESETGFDSSEIAHDLTETEEFVEDSSASAETAAEGASAAAVEASDGSDEYPDESSDVILDNPEPEVLIELNGEEILTATPAVMGAVESDDPQPFDNYDDAVRYVREQAIARKELISILVPEFVFEKLNLEVYDDVLLHTGDPRGGDYLRSALTDMRGGYDYNGEGYFQVEYHFFYKTTAAEEQAADGDVDNLLDRLGLQDSTKSPYEKIKAIHDYITSTVEYDYDTLYGIRDDYPETYTGYGALVRHLAVCQGYSAMFYRLCLECGIDARIINSNYLEHAWNIVELEDLYYLMDCTWDENSKSDTWFLRGKKDFSEHVNSDDNFQDSDFARRYPLADYRYGLEMKNLGTAPDFTLITPDHCTVSTAAQNRRAKAVVFIKDGCMNCQATLESLRGKNYPGVDFVYVSLLWSGSDQQYALSQLGKEFPIDVPGTYTFCANGSDALREMVSVTGIADPNEGIYTAAVFLINPDNQIVYAEQGYCGDLGQLVEDFLQDPDAPDAPAPVLDDFGDPVSMGICGKNAVWSYFEDGTVHISGSGELYDNYYWPTQIGWLNEDETVENSRSCENIYRSTIKNVIIDKGITYIGCSQFEGCTSLETITFKGNAPSFYEYQGVSQDIRIYYPENDTTWNAVDKSLFSDGTKWISQDADGVHHHAWSAWKTTKAATVQQTGLKEHTCKECGEKETKTIPKLDPVSIEGASVSFPASITYTGSALKPATTVKVGSTVLKAGTDYSVIYTNNTNAGKAAVTITGKGNYTGTLTASFTIGKAAQSITAKASAASVSVGKTATVSITGAKGTKTYVSSDTSIATVNSKGKVVAKKVGIVKITAKASATTNYKSSSRIVTIKVVPAAAASLKAINQATGIKLNWKKVAGANGYIIYRNNRKIKTIGKGATVTYTDTAANSNGTKYAYKIFAKASTGTSTLSKSIVTYRVAQPAIKTLKNSVAKKATATWEKNAGATGYEVQYGLKKNFSDANIVTIKKAATVKITFSKLTKDRTYYVRMRAYKTVGKSKYYSAWSAAKTVKITK